MAVSSADVLFALRRRQLVSARDLAHDLRTSQPTLSRALSLLRDEYVVLGKARATRYAAVDPSSAFRTGVPLFRVNAAGRVRPFGTLTPLLGGKTLHVRGTTQSLHASLPWFIEDLRPQGFLGRLLARSLSRDLGASADPRLWTTDQVLRALAYRADDVPGDLLVGTDARDRFVRASLQPSMVERDGYEGIVGRQLAGEPPGSSAGGEQPKFACRASPSRHVLVKYSPPLDASRAARRWADLLRCEELALAVLRSSGIAAARAEYVEYGGRAYLEVERFDRTPEGRRGVVTGTMVDAEWVGSGAWIALAEGLAAKSQLVKADAARVRLLHTFGGLIGNTDMHLGNVAFFTDDYARFRLAPSYDMLPMALRPTAHGELPTVDPELPLPAPGHLATWRRAAALADETLAQMSTHRGLDEAVRDFALRTRAKVAALRKVAHRIA